MPPVGVHCLVSLLSVVTHETSRFVFSWEFVHAESTHYHHDDIMLPHLESRTSCCVLVVSNTVCLAVLVVQGCGLMSTSVVPPIAMSAILLWLVLVCLTRCICSLFHSVVARGGTLGHHLWLCIWSPISTPCGDTFGISSDILACCFDILDGWKPS